MADPFKDWFLGEANVPANDVNLDSMSGALDGRRTWNAALDWAIGELDKMDAAYRAAGDYEARVTAASVRGAASVVKKGKETDG